MTRLIQKRVYRERTVSKNIVPGHDRPINGFGYTIIPGGIARDDYIKQVYQTSYVMLITSDREVLRDVKVPSHLIDDLTFPEEEGKYGQLISWGAIKDYNQLILTGIYTKPGEFHPYLENISVKRFPSRGHEVLVSADGNAPSYTVSVRDNERGDGSIIIKAHSESGVSSITLGANGVGAIEFDDTLFTVINKRLQVDIGQNIQLAIDSESGATYTDGYGNALTIIDGEISVVDALNNSISLKEGEMKINSDSVNIIDKQLVINGETVTIAEGTEPLVLGQQLVTLLTNLINQISILTVTCSSPGSPSSPPINGPVISQLSSQLQQLLSQTAFTK
jgi:hypothetical protein